MFSLLGHRWFAPALMDKDVVASLALRGAHPPGTPAIGASRPGQGASGRRQVRLKPRSIPCRSASRRHRSMKHWLAEVLIRPAASSSRVSRMSR
jgi:hypothetical protein